MAKYSVGALIPFREPGLRPAIKELSENSQVINDLTHIELWTEEAETYYDIRNVRLILGDLGLRSTIHAPFTDFSLTTKRGIFATGSVDVLKRTINMAEGLGSECITIHPGEYMDYEGKITAMARLAERLFELQDKTSVLLAVENLRPKNTGVKRTLFSSKKDMDDFLGLYPGAYFTLDTGHAMQAGIDIADVLNSELGRHIASVHLHEVGDNGRSHQMLGSGSLTDADLGAILRHQEGRPITLEMLSMNDIEASLGFIAARTQYLDS